MSAQSGSAPPGEATALENDPKPQSSRTPDLEAPDAAFTRQRWIPAVTRDWVYQADKILLEHGAVVGRAVLEKRYQARHRAQRLMRLMVELRLHEQWELGEHTEAVPGGWRWTVEYKGR